MDLRRLWMFLLVALAVLALIGSLWQTPASASADSTKRVPVIVELFTSEGCSSCPPADALLQRLEDKQPVPGAEIIVLETHVDYWNHGGWTDKFSSREYSLRQDDYARTFGIDSVYTPQMVVDGRTEFNGTFESRAVKAIAESARDPKAIVVLTQIETNANAETFPLQIKIDSVPSTQKAVVVLALTEGRLETSVRGGENKGRTMKHTGVVRDLRVIGKVEGGTFSAERKLKLDRSWKRPDLRAIVFVQDPKTRHILGAGTLMLTK